MQFKVPQFLDIEDKIFGPFTFRQFTYLAGGAGLSFVLYKLMGLIFGAVPIILVAGFALLLAFYRPNNKPFIDMAESWLKYFTQSKLYIWQHQDEKQKELRESLKNGNQAVTMQDSGVKLTGSKLRDLAWSLDVLDLSKKKEN